MTIGVARRAAPVGDERPDQGAAPAAILTGINETADASPKPMRGGNARSIFVSNRQRRQVIQ